MNGIFRLNQMRRKNEKGMTTRRKAMKAKRQRRSSYYQG
jgi:hypothetical protein